KKASRLTWAAPSRLRFQKPKYYTTRSTAFPLKNEKIRRRRNFSAASCAGDGAVVYWRQKEGVTMLRKTVFTIFLVLFLLGCALLLAAGTILGQLSRNLPLANLIGDAGLPLVFLGVGGMLMLPVMGKASRRGRHFYRVLGVGIPLIYLAS